MKMTVEVPGPVPSPHIVHGADHCLLSSQSPQVVPPGQVIEVIRAGPHRLHHAHAISHPRQPVDDAENHTSGYSHLIVVK